MTDPPRPSLGRPPWLVIIAAALLVLLAAQEVMILVAYLRLARNVDVLYVAVAIRIILALLFLLVGWFVLRRVGWVRWLLFVPFVQEAARVIRLIRVLHFERRILVENLPYSAGFLLPLAVMLITLILLFWPARAWFRR